MGVGIECGSLVALAPSPPSRSINLKALEPPRAEIAEVVADQAFR
jgi:hypothetical protein